MSPIKLVLAVVLSLCLNTGLGSGQDSNKVPKENTQGTSSLLKSLLNKDVYDKHLRPNYGGPRVNVSASIYVSRISDVSELNMDFTLDIYFRQTWTDDRLAFSGQSVSRITLDHDYINQIWLPDTFFPNEKRPSSFKNAANSFARIASDGQVLQSCRLTVTASCAMDLHIFPFDVQECTLEIESYGYSEEDIAYSWLEPRDNAVKLDHSIALPQFSIRSYVVTNHSSMLSTGNYSRLAFKVLLGRRIGFYILQIYIPLIMLVFVSWISFWLSKNATNARAFLGLISLLGIIVLILVLNLNLPKISYTKAIDVYTGVCLFMVFASLVEYAIVSYFDKGGLNTSIETQNEQMAAPLAGNMVNPSLFGNLQYASQQPSMGLNPIFKITKPNNAQTSTWDKFSRFVFPIVFLIFNLAYWIGYGSISFSGINNLLRNYSNSKDQFL